MDYNYLKTLPKDILIKIITELESNCMKDQRKWFVKVVKDNRLNTCIYDDCDKILHFLNEHSFRWCETCNVAICRDCIRKHNVPFHSCEGCGEISLCHECQLCIGCEKCKE